MIYQSRTEVLEALRRAPFGKPRQKILDIKQNRDLILNSGANVTLVAGKTGTGNTIKKQLQNIRLGLIARLNAKTGAPDGIGALGGLAERISEEEFARLDEADQKKLIGFRDDVILQNGMPVLTTDINIIRINNILRETREELENLGITDFKLPADAVKLVKMPGIRDDNYAVNIWNGKNNVWAITPYCHILRCPQETLNMLVQRSQDLKQHQTHSEAAEFMNLPLFEALKRYGSFSGTERLEDGRNAQTDYRYPHEWLVSWYIASAALKHDDNAFLRLMTEVQDETPWKISFRPAAEKFGKDLDFVAGVLKISPDTVRQAEKIMPNTSVSALNRNNPRQDQ